MVVQVSRKTDLAQRGDKYAQGNLAKAMMAQQYQKNKAETKHGAMGKQSGPSWRLHDDSLLRPITTTLKF